MPERTHLIAFSGEHGPAGTAYCHPAVDGTDDAAVIVCHGFVQNADAFAGPQRSWIQHLVQGGFVVYEISLRGRDGAALHTFRDLVDHDVPAIWQEVAKRHRRVFWLGHSLGGLLGVVGKIPVGVDVAGVVTVAAPLIPGPAWLPQLGIEHLVRFVAGHAHRGGFSFPGRSWSRALFAAKRILDRTEHPAAHHVWAAQSLKEDELSHALLSTFSNDSWALLADLIELRMTQGRTAGGVDVDGRVRSFAAPLLVIWGTKDGLAPPSSARALYERAGSLHKEFVELDAGHVDLVVGSRAERELWPRVGQFLVEVKKR